MRRRASAAVTPCAGYKHVIDSICDSLRGLAPAGLASSRSSTTLHALGREARASQVQVCLLARMPVPASWLVLACVLLWGRVSSVLAQPLAIPWSAPAQCPSQEDFVRSVGALTDADRAASAQVVARGTVVARGARFVLRLSVQVGKRNGVRTLEADTCDSLAQVAAWLIAVAVDPERAPLAPVAATATSDGSEAPAVRAPPPAPTPLPGAGVEAKSEPNPSASRVRSRTPAELWYRVGLFTGVWAAGLPSPQASLGLRLGLGMGRGYLELRGAHMFSRSADAASGELQASSQELGITGCLDFGARLRGGPCAVLSGLRTHASTRGISAPAEDTIWWASAGLAAHLSWLVRAPWELHAEAGAALPISPRPRFLVEGEAPVLVAHPVSAYGQLGVSLRLK